MPRMNSTPADDTGRLGRHARLLDAVSNRLGEALRAVEDQLRFELEAPALAQEWKELRHRLGALRLRIESAAGGALAGWRDVDGDAGAPPSASTDTSAPGNPSAPKDSPHGSGDHASPASRLAANASRAREASRSLEETLRHAAPGLAGHAERLRYDTYRLEAAAIGRLRRAGRLARARLYVLLTTDLAASPLDEVARAAIAGGADIIQLREKHLPRGEFLDLARRLAEIIQPSGALFLVNDAIDIAALCGADGVHQGQEDLSPSTARRLLGPDAIVGVSTHGLDQARRAVADGADYIGVGPVYPTRTKEHRAAVGLSYVREVSQAIDLPGFAIGSVNLDSVDDVLAAGARRIAICTGIIAQPDVERATRAFRAKLDAIPLDEPEARAAD